MSDFEKKIWDGFLEDRQRSATSRRIGHSRLHGDAVSIKVEKGKTYRVTVRAAAGPEISVESDAPPAKQSSIFSWERKKPGFSGKAGLLELVSLFLDAA